MDKTGPRRSRAHSYTPHVRAHTVRSLGYGDPRRRELSEPASTAASSSAAQCRILSSARSEALATHHAELVVRLTVDGASLADQPDGLGARSGLESADPLTASSAGSIGAATCRRHELLTAVLLPRTASEPTASYHDGTLLDGQLPRSARRRQPSRGRGVPPPAWRRHVEDF